jgi:hypothetical protein
MSLLTRRLDRLQAELDARNMVKREPIVRQVPCWQDPQEYLDQMVASGEITEAQREDVVLIQRVIVRPIHELDRWKNCGSARRRSRAARGVTARHQMRASMKQLLTRLERLEQRFPLIEPIVAISRSARNRPLLWQL